MQCAKYIYIDVEIQEGGRRRQLREGEVSRDPDRGGSSFFSKHHLLQGLNLLRPTPASCLRPSPLLRFFPQATAAATNIKHLLLHPSPKPAPTIFILSSSGQLRRACFRPPPHPISTAATTVIFHRLPLLHLPSTPASTVFDFSDHRPTWTTTAWRAENSRAEARVYGRELRTGERKKVTTADDRRSAAATVTNGGELIRGLGRHRRRRAEDGRARRRGGRGCRHVREREAEDNAGGDRRSAAATVTNGGELIRGLGRHRRRREEDGRARRRGGRGCRLVRAREAEDHAGVDRLSAR